MWLPYSSEQHLVFKSFQDDIKEQVKSIIGSYSSNSKKVQAKSKLNFSA